MICQPCVRNSHQDCATVSRVNGTIAKTWCDCQHLPRNGSFIGVDLTSVQPRGILEPGGGQDAGGILTGGIDSRTTSANSD